MKIPLLKHVRLRKLDIVIFGIVICLGIFVAYTFFRKSTYVVATVKVGSESVLWWDKGSTNAWFHQYFREGNKELDGFGGVVAEVLHVRSYDTAPNQKAVYVTVRLKVVFNRASDQFTFRGKPVLIGSTVRLHLDRLLAEGLVTAIEGVENQTTFHKTIVEAKLIENNAVYLGTEGVNIYRAEALNVGDEIKDSQNNTVIKILQKRVEDAETVVTTSNGLLLKQRHPVKKDVYYRLEVNAQQIGDRYYVFDDVPLLVGEVIPLNIETAFLTPVVTSIRVDD